MKLIYLDKEIELIECDTFFKRFLGFMFKKNINNSLLFNKCNSIHTFFMKENIDVIMCDRDNNILFFYKNLGRNKIILPKKNVSIVYETPANYFDVKIKNKMKVCDK